MDCIHPQSLWGSGAVACASQLVCPKLSGVLITRCTGLSHYKLDGDGGIQFLLGCDLGLHCNIISRSDELISRSDDII